MYETNATDGRRPMTPDERGIMRALDAPPDDPRAMRDALGRFATGVCVVTTAAPTGPLGITANSFSSVSLDPPLVLWSPAKASRRFEPFVAAEGFAIHVIGADRPEVAQAFVTEGNAFPALDWRPAEDGTPLIEDCLARFHCRRHAVHDAGDHAIVLGRVVACTHREGEPLIFSAGRYGAFTART